ncbi:MAG: CHASE domain-containing protein [Nitrospirota bacterium]|nr:CHASE domain-containing protein [Nitrospirota bacterium]
MKLRPVAVLAAGIIISLLLWRFSSDYFFKKEQERFEFEAKEIILNLSNKLRLNGTILEGGEGLFTASERVTRREWKSYIQSLRLKDQYPGIQGVGFAKCIRPRIFNLQGCGPLKTPLFPEVFHLMSLFQLLCYQQLAYGL